MELPTSDSPLVRACGLFVVLALFCAPLFIGLDGWDLSSDEAIYSYSVDRILETGEWLTPRSIQVDGPFLEKPPLKFWMVAAVIRAGLVPHDEWGFRFLDALMGASAFVYIYLFGFRLAGPVCGVVSALAIFSMPSLVYEHGIRSNNMEAPLLLAYCGGLYHFTRWVESNRPFAHMIAIAVYFVLGVMTKFVAALFLPLIVVIAIGTVPIARARARARWRDLMIATSISVALISPWFLYESVLFGRYFWSVMLGMHVYTRFTDALDVAHLQPWYYYFTRTWQELAGQQVIAGVGGLALVVAAYRGRPWQMRLLLFWWLVPFVLISIGTSKLFHYAYPFLPPIAIGVGWIASAVLRAASGERATRVANRSDSARWWSRESSARWQRHVPPTLVLVAVVLIAIAVVTAVSGPVSWRVGGVRLFQNSSLVRPLLMAALLLVIAGRTRVALKVLAAVALVVALPVSTYRIQALRAATIDNRLRAIRDCAAAISQAYPAAPRGVYNAARTHTNHTHYYYLFRLGAWQEPESARPEDVRSRVFHPDQQTLVLMTTRDYDAVRGQIRSEAMTEPMPPAFFMDEIAIVMPGPYRPCATVPRPPP